MGIPEDQDFLKKYILKNFVETGSEYGNGIDVVLPYAEKIYSIELFKDLHSNLVVKYAKEDKVNLYNGSSVSVLPRLLEEISGPTTFWLDAHDNSPNNPDPTPVLEEINLIHEANLHEKVVIIDDLETIKAGTRWAKGVKLDEIISALIGHGYEEIFEYNFIYQKHKPGLILVASSFV